MRRAALPLAVVLALAVVGLSACSSSESAEPERTTTTSTSTSTVAPYTSATYGGSENWLCRPDLSDDACDIDLDATLVRADGTTKVEKFVPATDPAADCFYVYPTISGDKGANSDLEAGTEERTVVANQFARFGSVCRLFAPVYRQVPLAGIGFGGGATTTTVAGAQSPREIAYADVLDAWTQYLANDNDGRPFVLVGHSQGAGHLLRLVREQIDTNDALRDRLVSAMLVGGGVPQPGTPGALTNVAPCERSSAKVPTGCVVSYASFLASEPPPEGSFFGQARDGGRVICTNPATLDASAGPLDSYFPSQRGGLGTAGAPETSTPFVRYEGLYTGVCVSDARNWLSVTNTAQPGDARPTDVGGRISPVWGLHLIDINLAMGNLVDLARRQIAAR